MNTKMEQDKAIFLQASAYKLEEVPLMVFQRLVKLTKDSLEDKRSESEEIIEKFIQADVNFALVFDLIENWISSWKGPVDMETFFDEEDIQNNKTLQDAGAKFAVSYTLKNTEGVAQSFFYLLDTSISRIASLMLEEAGVGKAAWDKACQKVGKKNIENGTYKIVAKASPGDNDNEEMRDKFYVFFYVVPTNKDKLN